MNPDLVGRRYALPEPYAVGREHVRAFARAVLAQNPLHFDVEAARAAGYADVIAPTTYPAVLQDAALQLLLAEPDAGFAIHQVVHGDEKFAYARPIVAGDDLRTELEVTSVKTLGGNAMISAATRITDTDGNDVVTATATLVVTAAAAGEGA